VDGWEKNQEAVMNAPPEFLILFFAMSAIACAVILIMISQWLQSRRDPL
jgi:uncharacterized membrane protein